MLSCKHANKILFQKIYPISFFVRMIIQVDLVLLWFQIGMGRKSHDKWTFYQKVEKNGKQRALCNQCMTDIVFKRALWRILHRCPARNLVGIR